ncbi:hypothetical protein C8A05DRAFT_34410 [Staphylotrichum tortipilum]|uniref:Cupin type-2 domain-containing protein n=1 Tax=Staphylotrichum tortipilum TaxID=2831512 RepID=A0AAN6MJ88_9PEZI|nr:hypothetical protein C8A05DRAFT_34410 [Staphylotrichum longicolle]
MVDDTTTSPKPTPSSSTLREPTPLSNLPLPTRHITTHSPSGLATIHTSAPFTFTTHDASNLLFSVPYTTSQFPPNLNANNDIAAHDALLASGTLGLVNPRGTVLRYVDFAPGYACAMHRTQSLDFGIVLEGEVEMVLDGGDRVVMKRGDVAVQRATQHQWVNCSKEVWARMVFVLQDCEKLVVGGKEMGEDLGEESGLPPSGK